MIAHRVPAVFAALIIASLGQALGQVDATRFDAKGQRLLQELKLASRLKPFGPKPGLITVKLSIEKDGTLQFTNQALGQALTPQASVFEKLSAMTAIRRHLGWAVAVELQPKSGVTEKQATQAVESLKTLQPHLVRLPVIKPN